MTKKIMRFDANSKIVRDAVKDVAARLGREYIIAWQLLDFSRELRFFAVEIDTHCVRMAASFGPNAAPLNKAHLKLFAKKTANQGMWAI